MKSIELDADATKCVISRYAPLVNNNLILLSMLYSVCLMLERVHTKRDAQWFIFFCLLYKQMRYNTSLVNAVEKLQRFHDDMKLFDGESESYRCLSNYIRSNFQLVITFVAISEQKLKLVVTCFHYDRKSLTEEQFDLLPSELGKRSVRLLSRLQKIRIIITSVDNTINIVFVHVENGEERAKYYVFRNNCIRLFIVGKTASVDLVYERISRHDQEIFYEPILNRNECCNTAYGRNEIISAVLDDKMPRGSTVKLVKCRI